MSQIARVSLCLSFCLVVAHLTAAPWLAPRASAVPLPQCPPKLYFTYVPPYGSFENLWGGVDCVQPANDSVAVYIQVNGGWWTKPTFAAPLTPIRADGTWTTDITTGGNDQNATRIAAFLVPTGYTPPPMNGGPDLPSVLFQNAVDYIDLPRGPLPVTITIYPTRTRTATTTPTTAPTGTSRPTGTPTIALATTTSTPSVTATWTATVTPSPTLSPTRTPSATPTPIPTVTPSPAVAPSPTWTPTQPTATPAATLTATPTASLISTSPTPTSSPTTTLTTTSIPLYFPYLRRSATPAVAFTYVPPYGSVQNLGGHVAGVAVADYRVAVYIYVGGWWTKPTFDQPLTSIADDGTWTTDITTGGQDQMATQIAAFLIPVGYTPPLLLGAATLPTTLFEAAPAHALVAREPALRQLQFAGHTWQVKASTAPVGPGPNRFSDRLDDVWVDGQGRLHLRIANHDGQWYSSEVINTTPFGHGTYTFSLGSPVNQLDPNAVLGLFTYDPTTPESAYREVDIEFARWGQSDGPNAQYVVQPWDQPGRRHRFNLETGAKQSTHRFTWHRDQVVFESRLGPANAPPPMSDLQVWTYSGPDIPPAGYGTARINLWLFNGTPPSDGQALEVVIEGFTFLPH